MSDESLHGTYLLPPLKQKHKVYPLSFTDLQFLAIIIILSATGAVPYLDVVFALLASLYAYFLSKFAFPPVTTSRPLRVFAGNKLFRNYVGLGAMIGLFLPLAYITGGFLNGDGTAVLAAVPHTFLLACQVVTEQLAFNLDGISLPVRAFVPVFYNTRRLFSISDWFMTYVGTGGESIPVNQWLYFGWILSVANMIFWSYNLFGFLLPVFLPRAFRRYYEAERALKASTESPKSD